MKKLIIDQMVIWTHPFHTAKFTKNIRESKLNEKELKQAISVILKKMKKTVDAMAKRKRTAFVLVGSKFHGFVDKQTGKIEAPGINELVGRDYSDFIHHCRQKFGNRFMALPPKIGYSVEKNTERIVNRELKKLKRFTISENLRLFRAGERTMQCVSTSNSRVAKSVKRLFGVEVPKNRMHSVAEHNFSHLNAMATLGNAGNHREFLQHTKRPTQARRAQSRRPGKKTIK